MSAKPQTRENLLQLAFTNAPNTVGAYTLRPLSAGSFTLLGRLGNPMIVGLKANDSSGSAETAMFDAIIQYIWIHVAPIEAVICIETSDQIPLLEIRKLGFEISIGEAFDFLSRYQESANGMLASLAEVEDQDEEGKLRKAQPLPAGSPLSSLPAVEPETPPANITSFGSCPSPEPSPTSTPPTSQEEIDASGPVTLELPQLSPTSAPS